MSTCPYSGTYIPLPRKNKIPIKCEYCGATRTVKNYSFPSHTPLNGYPVDRDHWEYRDGTWQIVEKGATP